LSGNGTALVTSIGRYRCWAMAAGELRILLDLPEELAIVCFEHVDDLLDAANLCLALPRLGLAAKRSLDVYKDPPAPT